jgi:hypothetical protein
MKGESGGQPLAIARLSVTRWDSITYRLVPVGVRVGDSDTFFFTANRHKEPAMQNGKDVITLDRGNNVLGAADHLGQPLLHLLTCDARVVLQIGTRQRCYDGGRVPRSRAPLVVSAKTMRARESRLTLAKLSASVLD